MQIPVYIQENPSKKYFVCNHEINNKVNHFKMCALK